MKEITKPNPQIGVFDVCVLREEDKRVEVVSFFEQEGYVVLLLCEELKDHPIVQGMKSKACFDQFQALCVIRNGGKNFNAKFHRNIDVVDSRVMSKKHINLIFSENLFEKPYQIRGMAKVLLREM